MIAAVFVSMEIIGAISRFFEHNGINKLETDGIFDLKRKYFNHIIGLSHSFFTTHKTGSLISRLVRGGNALERMTDVFMFNGIPLVFQLIIALTSIFYFDWVSSMILGITAIVFVAYSVLIQRMQESSNIEANKNEDIEKANISDIFTNVDSIKYFGKENYIKKRFTGLAEKTRDSFLKNWNYYRIMVFGQSLILGAGTFLLIYFSVLKLLSGQISIGTIVFIYSVYIGLIGPLFGFVNGIRNFYRSMADFQDLFEYGKIESEIKDKPNAEECRINNGIIEFKNIDFSYGKRKIFDNFSLKVNKNEKVALVGHSGSGKSTLVKLLYRLYDVSSGKITIDGKDIRDFKHESLRKEMAIVPQECILFDDTVSNNIAFSRPEARKDDVVKAIKFAQLDSIIKQFPQKENTIVGERGIKLSGGEKQRVSIARAILSNRKVLVLDEATSSLDSQTEHEIQADLKELMKGRTSIVIAHRLSTIMNADKIVVMKNGKIVQMGNHEKLIKQPGEYKHLWNLQKGGYIK
jgi:ATP-binding cassette subfamily B protein